MKKRRRGQYFKPHTERASVYAKVISGLSALIAGEEPRITEEFYKKGRDVADTLWRKGRSFDDQVLDDKTHGLRHLMRAAAQCVTVPAYIVRTTAPFPLLAIPNWIVRSAALLGATINCVLTEGSIKQTEKYYKKPKLVLSDTDTIRRAWEKRKDSILTQELKTVFTCERDNTWFRSLAIASSEMTKPQKIFEAIKTGFGIGWRHNVISSLRDADKERKEIAFRLNDGFYQNAVFSTNPYALSEQLQIDPDAWRPALQPRKTSGQTPQAV